MHRGARVSEARAARSQTLYGGTADGHGASGRVSGHGCKCTEPARGRQRESRMVESIRLDIAGRTGSRALQNNPGLDAAEATLKEARYNRKAARRIFTRRYPWA